MGRGQEGLDWVCSHLATRPDPLIWGLYTVSSPSRTTPLAGAVGSNCAGVTQQEWRKELQQERGKELQQDCEGRVTARLCREELQQDCEGKSYSKTVKGRVTARL